MNYIKRITHWCSLVIYLLIILYAVLCLPAIVGYKPLVVLSGSMEPTFKTGSVIYYKNVEKEDLKNGDIVTYVLRNNFVSHRIVKINNNMMITKGDANEENDPIEINMDRIVGRDLNFSVPILGYYVQFINSHLVLTTVLSIIILLSEFLFTNTEIFDIDFKRKE